MFRLGKLKFRSIQANIIAAFMYLIVITILIIAAFMYLIVITILIIALMAYYLAFDSLEINSKDYTAQLISQVNDYIDSYVTNMENISHMVFYNSDLREYLADDISKDKTRELSLEKKINNLMSSILSSRNDINSIVVFGNNGNVISEKVETKINKNINIRDQSWYRNALNANGEAVISSSHVQNLFQDEYRWVVSLSRSIKSYDNEQSIGVMLVDLNFNVISSMCSKIKLGKRGYIFIVDSQGNMVYHPQQQLVYSKLKNEDISRVLETSNGSFIANENGEKRIYTVKTSMNTGWKTVGVTYVNELVGNKKQMQLYYLSGGTVCLLIAIILAIFMSRRISKPVKILESSMNEAEKGNFDIKVNIESDDEIGELSKAFNIMIAKIKELMLQNLKEQELKRKSELKALQAQINPHFLYNTLDSIIWMAEGKKCDEVVMMTSSLAKLFRLSISKGEEIITIRNEIEHIKSYLTIQKMRYRDKLDFEIDVDENILKYRTLKILLQPLVENAIYHGIKNKEGTGVIRITGGVVGDCILLQVIDNGVGMSSEEVENILKSAARSESGSGVGVKNVNERIKIYFGENYGLEFISRPDEGTTANIRLPILE